MQSIKCAILFILFPILSFLFWVYILRAWCWVEWSAGLMLCSHSSVRVMVKQILICVIQLMHLLTEEQLNSSVNTGVSELMSIAELFQKHCFLKPFSD